MLVYITLQPGLSGVCIRTASRKKTRQFGTSGVLPSLSSADDTYFASICHAKTVCQKERRACDWEVLCVCVRSVFFRLARRISRYAPIGFIGVFVSIPACESPPMPDQRQVASSCSSRHTGVLFVVCSCRGGQWVSTHVGTAVEAMCAHVVRDSPLSRA